MSGFVGIINLDRQPVDRELLTQMTTFLAFRGPDGSDTWIKENVGFGHALFRTTQDHNESLPLTLNGKIWLTAHARIDGRRDLVAELSDHFPPLTQESPGDGKLILLAYQVWGEDCVRHLIGDFSFVIWDEPRQRLFCARDQMGVGQFYYAYNRRSFICSNTLNCLRSHPAVSAKLNDVAIGDFLLFGLNQEPDTTIFADIQRLPRAHSLSVTSGGLRKNEYWKPEVGTVRYKSNREYVERFKELLDTAVTDRLRSSRVGVAMSGGLDSSIVAATATARLQRTYFSSELKAYCVVYGRSFPDDEKKYAREVATALNITIEFLEADDINEKKSLRTWGNASEPFDVEPFYVVSDELLRRISTAGRVALTGWDDIFMTESARHLFYDLWRRNRLWELSKELFRYVYFQRRPPPIGVRTWWQQRSGRSTDGLYPVWINKEFEKRNNLRDRWKEWVAVTPSLHPTRPYAFKILKSPHWNALLARFDSGQTGLPLEVRHPLIDLRLAQFLLSVPVVPWLQDKHILREAMRRVLPDSIRCRKKTVLAGDPGLAQRQSSKIFEVDTFLPEPEVLNYIKREAVPSLVTETDSNRLWVNARPFSLNQWLINSYRVNTFSIVVEHQHDREHSQTYAFRSAQ